MRYERHHEPLLPPRVFAARLARSVALAGLLVGSSLALGTLGYRYIAGLEWVDAVYDATMILTGMGPATPISTSAAKLFASGYALFSAVVFLTSVGIVVGPLLHRFLHWFHLEGDAEPPPERERSRSDDGP